MDSKELYEKAKEAKNSGEDSQALGFLSEIIENHADSLEADLAMAMRYKIKNKAMRYNVKNKEEVTVSDGSPPVSNTPLSSEYGTARFISQVVSGIGWAVVIMGVITGLIGMSDGFRSVAVLLVIVLPGIGIAVSGLFLVVAGEITRATVDNADHTREILSVIRKKI